MIYELSRSWDGRRETEEPLTPFTMEWAAAIVCELVGGTKYPFYEMPMENGIRLFTWYEVSAKPVNLVQWVITVDGNRETVTSEMVVPTIVQSEDCDAVAEYCGYASSCSKDAELCLDKATGHLCARRVAPFCAFAGDADAELFKMFANVPAFLGYRLAGLYEVIGGRNPFEAFGESRRAEEENRKAQEELLKDVKGGEDNEEGK